MSGDLQQVWHSFATQANRLPRLCCAGTHNFHGNSRSHGGAGQGSSMRWLPELPPAMKVPSAAFDPSAVSQPLVSFSGSARGMELLIQGSLTMHLTVTGDLYSWSQVPLPICPGQRLSAPCMG